ncbi:GNAT family N-acetyltransferase [Streptomyces sp. NBC_01800]|uniref:GNAT family N-acetyltransferase n=1 Tax=Streptomyces sp. NBC_01800 TaxID=2975945 RepID=UPI002DDAA90E|nr:GNAT family N-acetyltransferase [Streptomyces sp. NBC_01800]WSA66181.1 GNAT family N-acetyltransferase [Streptomyces sp. NBC_01800]
MWLSGARSVGLRGGWAEQLVPVPDQIMGQDGLTRMNLLPFATAHAAMVADWPTASAEVVMWCGRQEFPVPAQTISAWQQDDDVQAHVLVEGEKLVGYGELWFDAEEDEVELARIIVAPEARGKGLGRVLVRGLLAQAHESGCADVFMRVHPGNEKALRCYLGAGFRPVAPGLAENWNAAQPVNYVWLRHDAEGSGD